MRKLIIFTLILSLVLTGCFASDPDSCTNSPSGPNQATQDTTVPGQTDQGNGTSGTWPEGDLQDSTSSATDASDSVGTDSSGNNTGWPAGPTEGTTPTELKPTSPQATEPTTPTNPPEETKPTTPPETTPTNPPGTTPTNPPGTTPTQPPETKPEETELPATTLPTEPAGCNHEWKCIHHPEEGHWRAGIICDCGWTAYGDPGELTALWNAHSASYPPAESLFDHGGFGSMDEWIVDKPAYDEWVCRHCGEPKP